MRPEGFPPHHGNLRRRGPHPLGVRAAKSCPPVMREDLGIELGRELVSVSRV